MPPKRTRRSSPGPSGLHPGERLKRAKLAGSTQFSTWDWVGTEVMDASEITPAHCLSACGFSSRNLHPLCKNKFIAPAATESTDARPSVADAERVGDDVIIISDDDAPTCSNKSCKGNPHCLNHLGQEKWEEGEKACRAFMKRAELGMNPSDLARAPGHPVGLKNLGATCYANAYLQVWFQDLTFRRGVYRCQPSQDVEHKFEDSPIFQLQVTFTAMQEGVEAAFNPVKLVESLRLRTTEQQDAQEFSKLFMAHLDTEFQKQIDPSLKSLIAEQFQGKQAYCTVCENCHNVSERESDFLEIEVNIKHNASLQDSINSLLEPEVLMGDNKYFCQRCDSLQDAKRYTELRELPPVLHFSLLRFVYDVRTMERKKSKSIIKFPTVIDMDHFLGTAESRAASSSRGRNIYALRGILLHKGPSAYHGHYEAQVFDTQKQAWYQFNDEIVTEVKSLLPKSNGKGKETTLDGGEKKRGSGVLKQNESAPTKKRKRVDSDSDVEVVEQTASASHKANSDIATTHIIESRDAYMLIYARVENVDSTSRDTDHHAVRVKSQYKGQSDLYVPVPPTRALDVVKRFNAEHQKACEAFAEKERCARARFDELRRMVMDVYKTWQLSSWDEEGIVVSRQVLESWLSRHLAAPSKQETPAPAAAQTPDPINADHAKSVLVSQILCQHNKLDPEKASDMKLITKHARQKIADNDGCVFVPELSQKDACRTCVKEGFAERLYEMEHPRLVARFDELSPLEEDEPGFWISKPWLKDWRLGKPKMHARGQPDPPPDADEFKHHVLCEHNGLATNTTNRRRISSESCTFLQGIFPSWQPPSADTELCPVCEALVHISREGNREIRRQAEEEKAILKQMHDDSLSGNTAVFEDVPCAIVPAEFVREWRQWVSRPAEVNRPAAVDNSQFLCDHGMLCLDPNLATDLDSSVAVIRRSDWEVLENIYSGGPLIAIQSTGGNMEHELPVCQECRRKRRSTYDMTEITIRVLSPKDPIPTPETYHPETVQPRQARQPSTLLTYGSRKAGGLRQSNRIRQSKDRGKRQKLTITQHMKLKDLRFLVQEELNVPIISQRLFYHGHELDDSTSTVESLGILSNDVLDLREEGEDIDLLSDSGDEHSSGKGRHGVEGFGGTVLGGMTTDTESEDVPAPSSMCDDDLASKACPACTYDNSTDVACCAMCETPLDL